MQLTQLKNKRVLILGFSREGRDTFLFLRKLFPEKILGIADKNTKFKIPNKKTKFSLGENYLKRLKEYDVVIKSPGIPFKILPKASLKKITTQTNLFFDNCLGRIIGVTGTKGKSTTASLIYEILKKGGVKVHLIGNIGKPVLSSLAKAKEDDVFVYELSSHQLFALKKSPNIAVFLNVFPEHLDYYKNFKEYVGAKANITKYQKKSDILVFNSQDKLVNSIAKKSKAKKIPIKGTYYDLNKEAAKAVAKIFKIDKKIVDKVIKDFETLPHRLELVGNFKGITFYNDSLATIPQATIEAIKTLKNTETLILGGVDRNIEFQDLAKEILKSKVKTLILFPKTGKTILKEIKKIAESRGVPQHFFVKDMKEAVRLGYKHTKKGNVCLLSPAAASFNLFKDYKERGDLFKQYVRQQGKR